MSTPVYNHYTLGQLVRVTGTFKDSDEVVQDPDNVYFSYKAPSDTTATTYTYDVDAELVKDSTGVYHVDIDANEVGTWPYRFFSTGNGQASEECRFIVQQSNFD